MGKIQPSQNHRTSLEILELTSPVDPASGGSNSSGECPYDQVLSEEEEEKGARDGVKSSTRTVGEGSAIRRRFLLK